MESRERWKKRKRIEMNGDLEDKELIHWFHYFERSPATNLYYIQNSDHKD